MRRTSTVRKIREWSGTGIRKEEYYRKIYKLNNDSIL